MLPGMHRTARLVVVVVLAGCPSPAPEIPRFGVGGQVAGFDAALGTLTLELNGTQTLEVVAAGDFTFAESLPSGAAFEVTITAQPAQQQCTVSDASGTIGEAAISSVRVQCTTRSYSVGGLARGVDRPGLTVRETTSNQRLALDAGAFTFPMPLRFGQPWSLTVDTAPVGRDCTASFASGTVMGIVDTARIDCSVTRLPLSVTLEGLDVAGIELTEATTTQTIAVPVGATQAIFPVPLDWETTFGVSALAPQGSGRTCGVDAGSGTITDSFAAPHVSCERQRFTVGGTLRGLDAGIVQLREQTTAQDLAASPPSFTFAASIPWDTTIAVELASQPANTFCVVDGGTRLVRQAITDIDVSCRPGFAVSGRIRNLRGSGLTLTQQTTQQTVTVAPATGLVAFDFAAVIPSGEPVAIAISTQPTGQTCRVIAPTATVAAPITDVLIVCGPRTSELVISELAAVPSATTPFWVELYNGTSQPIALADYTLTTGARLTSDAGLAAATAFALPDASIPPASAFLVSGKPFNDLHDSMTLRFLVQGGVTPAPGGPLRLSRGAVTVDSVAFEDAGAPLAWQGAGLVLPEASTDFGRSLQRAQGPDTDTAADFSACDFPTPGGLNDLCTSPDQDADGIPDLAEVPDSTWNELPLHEWGARTGQRDLFIEVDWMPANGFNGTFDPGVLPRREALERVRAVYAAHGLIAHFDSGALFHPADGFSPADFDLGGGNQTAFGCTVSLAGTSGVTSFYKLKADNADVRRRLAFHHVIFANALADVSCGNSGSGTSGVAEQGGNDVVITLGRLNLSLATQNATNQTINWQSATLMHELGHNLGLRHGGFEDANYKPNYLSVMNYYYQFDGLPVLGQNEGDRYFREYVLYGACSGPPGITSAAGLNRNRFTAPASFGLDYSDGSSIALDEAALDESRGFGRPGSGSVDWNWSTVIETGTVSANLNALNIVPRLCPRVSTGAEVLRDSNDWSAIVLTFSRTQRGSANKVAQPGSLRFDAFADHQDWAEESVPPSRR